MSSSSSPEVRPRARAVLATCAVLALVGAITCGLAVNLTGTNSARALGAYGYDARPSTGSQFDEERPPGRPEQAERANVATNVATRHSYDDRSTFARSSERLGGHRLAPRSATGVADDLCRVNSFVPATLVLMADGTTKPIADVRVGDMVMATDPETGEHGPRQVTDTIIGDGIKELVDIEIDGDVITATDRHPFWVDDDGRWVDAEGLERGDVLLLANGDTVTVDAVRARTEVRQVHNLTVDGIHTYYVLAGDDPVLVHNCVQPGQAGAYDDLARASDTGDALQIHHMPQRAQGFTSPGAGGSLVMTDAQHAATRTFGFRGSQVLAAESGMPFRQVLARDIWDVGSQYNAGLRDLLSYYRTNFPELMARGM